jgi:deoxyribonuclease-4
MIRFGPSGNSDLFYEKGFKHTFEAPAWVDGMGLTAFEYSFGHGVRISEDTAKKIRLEAEKYDLAMSVHAPYYINLAAGENLDKNLSYIEQSARAARLLGADRVVIHPGSASRMIRENAFLITYKSFSRILKILSEKGYGEIIYCPETMGKLSQIGDLAEISKLCELGDNVYPTVDFAHLHARSLGGIRNKEDYEKIIGFLEDTVGKEKTHHMHIHFSKVEYTKSGEKMHRNFADEGFGPDFRPFAEILAEKKMSPRIICESRGTQDVDAKAMLEIYDEERKRMSGK